MNRSKMTYWKNVPGAVPCQVAHVLPGTTCDEVSRFTKTKGLKPVYLCDHHSWKVGRLGWLPKKYRTETIVKQRRVTHRTSERSSLELKLEQQQETIDKLNEMIDRLIDYDIEKRSRPQSPNDPGFIYFLRVGGFYKIGWTSDLKRRMKSYYPDSALMCVYPGTRGEEKKLHKRWAHLVSHGREWFMLAPEITRHIEQQVKQHGEPEKVDFSAKIRAA